MLSEDALMAAARRYLETQPQLVRYWGREPIVATGERMYQIATLFERGGLGVEADPQEALQCHIMASELGFAASTTMVGEYYERGICVKRSARKARKRYQEAARQRDPRAQYNMGRLHFHGLLGQQKNQRTARMLWEMAAARKDRASRAALGYLYELGLADLSEDLDVATKWYTLAANQGCMRSAYNLGRLYETKKLTCTNNDDDRLQNAKHWYELAASQGFQDAKERLHNMISSQEQQSPAIHRDTTIQEEKKGEKTADDDDASDKGPDEDSLGRAHREHQGHPPSLEEQQQQQQSQKNDDPPEAEEEDDDAGRKNENNCLGTKLLEDHNVADGHLFD